MNTSIYTNAVPQGFTLPHTLSGRPEDASVLVAF